MVALSCYSFFSELFAGAGADGLAYFPIIVSVSQLMASAAVSTVLREWTWMIKAVLGLLIAVPVVLIVPVSSHPHPTPSHQSDSLCIHSCSYADGAIVVADFGLSAWRTLEPHCLECGHWNLCGTGHNSVGYGVCDRVSKRFGRG